MIPVKSGPDSYSGLPGLILHLNINDGEKEITAIDIQLKDIAEGAIVRPTEGKPIEQEEFKVLRKEKMEERRAERGGRGH